MGKVANFLIVIIITKASCGRGPAVVGLLFALLIPAGLLLVLIGALYPHGVVRFTENACRTVIRGLH
jgi:hypothetical protein